MVPLPTGSGSGYLPLYLFKPQLPTLDKLHMIPCDTFSVFNHLQALSVYLLNGGDGDPICEVAGGEARTTRILIRRNHNRIKPGPNFDLVTDVDLTDPQEQ